MLNSIPSLRTEGNRSSEHRLHQISWDLKHGKGTKCFYGNGGRWGGEQAMGAVQVPLHAMTIVSSPGHVTHTQINHTAQHGGRAGPHTK